MHDLLCKACTDRGLVCSAKARIFQYHAIGAKCTLVERPSVFIRDKPIFSLEGMLHMDYYRKWSVWGVKSLVVGLKGLDAKTKLLAVNRQS
jgi:hypothetical protein